MVVLLPFPKIMSPGSAMARDVKLRDHQDHYSRRLLLALQAEKGGAQAAWDLAG